MISVAGCDDPNPFWRYFLPHRTPDKDHGGETGFCKPGVLILDGSPVIDGLSIKRMANKKGCDVCGRGTHLQFKYGSFLGYRKCRKHLTATESALLWLMLTEAEAGN
jgi:hypothetical protein